MSFPPFDAWTITAWMIAAAWVVITVIFARAQRQQSLLRPMDREAVLTQTPRLSVILAARNESVCIDTCIRSLFRQDYPDLEVIAVNDRSTDDTAEILERLAIEFADRLRVIHVSNLPVGWFGKPHALTRGLQEATGSLVCFTDGDCEYQAPTALRTTVAELFRRNLDFFSITAMYTMTSVRESVVVPCCTEVLVTWLHPERVDDPQWPDAFSNGAFMLARKTAFEQIGGWGAVRSTISEDLQLARLAKRSGFRVGIAHGDGFYQTRSYATLRDSWNGWSRIFTGTLTASQLAITVGRMCILFVLPLVMTLWGLTDALRTGSLELLTSGAGLGFSVAFGLRCALDVQMFRLVRAPLVTVVLAPLGRLFVMAAATRALLSHAGLVHTHWRGAAFSAGKLVITRQMISEPQIQLTRAVPVSAPQSTAV